MNILLSEVATSILKKIVNSKDERIVIKENNFNFSSYESALQAIKNQEPNAVTQLQELMESRDNPSKAIVTIEDVDFIFKKTKYDDFISIYRIPNKDNLKFDDKFNSLVTQDNALFISMFKEMANLYHSDFFYRDDKNSEYMFSKFGIISNGLNLQLTQYVSEHFINLCRETGVELDPRSYDGITTIIENPLIPIPDINSDLTKAFNSWSELLIESKATISEPFIYNDHDNLAYYDSNEQNEMMVQQSQNVIYVYVRNKETGIIKVFNTVSICESGFSDLLDDFIADGLTYLQVMDKIIDTYGSPCYPIKIDDIEGYLKSPDYYLNNFDSDYNLIYDSYRGYNTNSKHVSNMITDLDIFNMLIEDNHF